MKGRLLRRRDRDEEAVELLTRACRVLDRNFIAASELGMYLADLGRRDEAREWLERSLTLDAPREWLPEVWEDAQEQVRAVLERLEGEVGPPVAGEGDGGG
jgi:tetratricopeptide (TPR) repeat protein